MRWPLENGLELTAESEGDTLVIRVSDGEVSVCELVQSETFASFVDVITDSGARLKLNVKKAEK